MVILRIAPYFLQGTRCTATGATLSATVLRGLTITRIGSSGSTNLKPGIFDRIFHCFPTKTELSQWKPEISFGVPDPENSL
eukprot:2928794-Rhodomonas_salina.1